MFKYDFIILYEHRNRELENAVLLAMMLEKKGYKVAIEYRRSARILFQKAKVLLTPFFFNNENVEDFAFQPFCQYKKIINLQYEQVFTKDNLESGLLFAHEMAVNARHIAWGENSVRLMERNGIQDNNIIPIGLVSLDFNSDKYRKAFFSKKYIAKKYNLPINKKWHLFISSFSYVGLTKAELLQLEKELQNTNDIVSISNSTQKKLLKWYDSFLKNNKDIVIIYRPHPHELQSKMLKQLQKKYSNFVCISDYSIRQWIRLCDSISTWYSTSLVDAYYAGKECVIVRPEAIPKKNDLDIFTQQKMIESYEEYRDYLLGKEKAEKINDDIIKKYYYNSFSADSMNKLYKVCIDSINDSGGYDYYKNSNVSKVQLIKIYIYKILLSMASFYDYSRFVPDKYRADVCYAHREMNNIKKEINHIRKRLSRVINDVFEE